MQKVEGSSPFSRFGESPAFRGAFVVLGRLRAGCMSPNRVPGGGAETLEDEIARGAPHGLSGRGHPGAKSNQRVPLNSPVTVRPSAHSGIGPTPRPSPCHLESASPGAMRPWRRLRLYTLEKND